jgi:hypothetical protein
MNFHITGSTTQTLWPDTAQTRYWSFAEDGQYGRAVFLSYLSQSFGPWKKRIVFLVEDNTALGDRVLQISKNPNVVVIRFPREISLLRNAQAADGRGAAGPAGSGTGPSPYLHFTLKDHSADDSVPQFSKESTPLSQEAQLMAIAREIRRFRAEFISIVASNVLDEVFLAQFLHRACPDARLMFFGSDLLLVREVDDIPFIGSILVTPYPLMGLGSGVRPFSSAHSLAYYNAVSYTFWDNELGRGWPEFLATPSGKPPEPVLQSYWNLVAGPKVHQPALWATTIAGDGYYPLGVLSEQSSGSAQILPMVPVYPHVNGVTIYPSRFWDALSCSCLPCVCYTSWPYGPRITGLRSRETWPFTIMTKRSNGRSWWAQRRPC